MDELETPSAMVELRKVQRNCADMADRMSTLGVKLRPHVKTHKCVEVAQLQCRGHFGGITVSTLAEAEFFAAAGWRDLTLAVPLAPGRLARVMALMARVDVLNLLLDHQDMASKLAEAGAVRGRPVPVFLKVDCGYGRAGVDPESSTGLALARWLHENPNLDFRGLLAHGGHAYHCVGREAIKVVAEEERTVTVDFAERLRAEGISVPEVSVGSTPTMSVADDLTGVTEVRPGNYAFFDLFQAKIGSCSIEDVAFSVLTEVIGVYPQRGQVIIDAGAIALSKDGGATHVDHQNEFGAIYTADGETPLKHLKLTGLSQEHGKVHLVGEGPLPDLGTRLRVLPNHSCLTAAAHHSFAVVNEGRVVDRWYPAKGW